MTLSGLGCRLQTCSCLVTEWFTSTFQAPRTVVVLPQVATEEPCSYSLSLLPPPQWDGDENQKEKWQTLVGGDKNSLTEWQREKKTTINNTDKKHRQHAVFSPPNTQLAPE